MKRFLFLLFLRHCLLPRISAGFGKATMMRGRPQCVFGVYEHKGIYYGRIIGTFDEEGKLSDTIYKPSGRAAGVVGNPHTCGLDIIYDLQDNGASFAGKILDPSKGKIYNCELWLQGGYLIVRGKLFIFGKNTTWYPVSKDDFPKGFKLPNMKQFVPKIPNVN